jgi:hypothetical protein
MKKFMRFLAIGKEMVVSATEGDLPRFKSLFQEAEDKEILYWHMIKAFKAAYKAKKVQILEFIIEDVEMPLNHEAFDGFLHAFIFFCQESEINKDDLEKDINRLICAFLMKGFGKDHIDTIEKSTGATPLISACELLFDLSIIQILVDAGACVNAVDNKDAMPLNIIKARLKKDPDNYELQDIYEYLKMKGAVRDWRKLTKKHQF